MNATGIWLVTPVWNVWESVVDQSTYLKSVIRPIRSPNRWFDKYIFRVDLKNGKLFGQHGWLYEIVIKKFQFKLSSLCDVEAPRRRRSWRRRLGRREFRVHSAADYTHTTTSPLCRDKGQNKCRWRPRHHDNGGPI